MNNYGFGFSGGFGGGAQMPWGAAGQGMARPQFQQTPYMPGPRQFPQLPPNYRRGMPYIQQRQSTLTPARPIAPPAARGVGAGLGGTAAQTGSPGYVSGQIRNQLQNPNFQPGFLSIPPEQTPVPPTYQSRMPQAPTQPPASGTPRQLTPGESGQLRSMDQQMQNMQYRDQNLPRYQSAVDDINRQTDSMERTQLPDVNSPNFQPITPQQAFMQIPGNYLSGYQDRFNRIKANPSPNVVNQGSMDGMTASQPTVTMPNYAQRLAQADPRVAGVAASGNGYAMSSDENRITPMPRASKEDDGTVLPGYLHAPELNRIAAVGGSAREWEAKSRWMANKGFTEYTPEVAQAYTAEKQQKRLSQNDAAFNRKMSGLNRAGMVRDYLANAKGQRFRIDNPGLFQKPDFTSAQLSAALAGADIKQFQQTGLTPAQAMQAQLQNDSLQATMIAQMPEGEAKARAIEDYQRSKQFGGGGVGGVPSGPPSGGGWSSVSSDEHNRDTAGKLIPGKMADKLSKHLYNPNASPTAQDLISDGINQFTLAELEQNFQSGMFSDPATHQSMRDMIARAKQILGQQKPSQPPVGQPQTTPVQQVPTQPPVQKVYNPQYPASY